MKVLIQIKNLLIVFGTVLLTFFAQAQIQFVQVLPPLPAPQIIPAFEGVTAGSIAFSDIDGDGNQDVMITGVNSNGQRIAKLYENDGEGNFTEITDTPFDGVQASSIAFADIDSDGDQDVLITGWNATDDHIAKLYENDGDGNFNEITDTPFDGVIEGSIAFSDIDGDGDQDVLITGLSSTNGRISKLYTNDGAGNYTEVTGTPFSGVTSSSISFADIDGDNDQDVLITGKGIANAPIARLYINDGLGNYTEVTGTPFETVFNSFIAFADIDNDGDQDVLITGQNASNDPISKLYTNDGMGNYTEVTGVPLEGVRISSIAFSDIDGDGDQDVLITGRNTLGFRISKLYTNDGMGNYTEVTGTPFDGVDRGFVSFSDIDGDGDQDVLIIGRNEFYFNISKIYNNDGTGNYTEVTGTPFDGLYASSVAFADIDNNGNQDVMIIGENSSNDRISKLYTNDGVGNYTEILGTPFDSVFIGSIAFSDIDNDGDRDVLITGLNTSNERIAKLYTNDGMGNYTEVLGTPFDGVRNSSIAFADIDSDGDQDILISGNKASGDFAKLYTNDGLGNYTEVTGTSFDGISYGSIAFSDIDNDGDQDVLITGFTLTGQRISKLYANDGAGNYTEVIGTPFDGVQVSSIAFSDIDGDGDQDVLITGENANDERIAKLYTNDGTGNFTEVIGTPFDGVRNSSIAFSDIDGDGNQDVLITGENAYDERIAKLYTNDGAGNFTEVIGTPFDGVRISSIAFSDIDGDGDQDVLITGENAYDERIAKLYRNVSCPTSSGIDVLNACDELNWIDGNTYNSSNNSATFNIVGGAANGCDSIVTLNLTIFNSFEDIDTITTCGSYTWPIDGNTYNQNGNYTVSNTNQAGCDSVHILDLTIDCSFYTNVSVTNNIGSNCDGDAQANVYNGISPYTYLYSNGETTPFIQNLCSGIYDLTVTDNNLDSYNTTFVVSDETVDYNSDSTYQDYQDSLFTSAISNCNLDYSQPIDSFYVDQNSIVQLGQNTYEVTWYVYQNSDVFIFTNVYYTTEDINGSFAYTLTMYCQDSTRSNFKSINLIYKTEGSLSLEEYSKNGVLLYPNPTSGVVKIEVPEALLGEKIVLRNSIGQLLSTTIITDTTIEYDISEHAKGIYFINIETHTGTVSKKLIRN